MSPPRWLYKPIGVGDRVVTKCEHGHVLHNANVWSPDGKWIVFDRRSDAAGSTFDSDVIEVVNPATKQVKQVFETQNGAKVGMASWSPVAHKREIVMTLGPENPSGAWTYAPHRRRGALIEVSGTVKFKGNKDAQRSSNGNTPAKSTPNKSTPNNKSSSKASIGTASSPKKSATETSKCRTLDARDLLPDDDEMFTNGALRGGTAAHSFSPDGLIVSGAYEDAVLLRNAQLGTYNFVEKNYRSISLTALDGKGGVEVDTSEHPRNHSGEGFTVVATTHEDDTRFADKFTGKNMKNGESGVARAAEECWVGKRGYRRSASNGGGWQGRAITFLGEVDTDPERFLSVSGDNDKKGAKSKSKKRRNKGGKHLELFVLDLQVDPSALRVQSAGDAPLSGSMTCRPRPPFGVTQRRITFTDTNRYPGLSAGPASSESSTAAAAAAEPDPCVASKGNAAGKAGAAGNAVGPRFWPRTSPDGARVCVVTLDDDGVPQLFLVRTAGGDSALGHATQSSNQTDSPINNHLLPLTKLPRPGVQSSFSWSPDGGAIAFVHDGSVCAVRVFASGDDTKPTTTKDVTRYSKKAKKIKVTRLTKKRFGKEAPRSESVSFSPCGKQIVYVRRVIRKGMEPPKLTGKPFEDDDDDIDGDGVDDWFNQICVVKFEYKLRQPFRTVKTVVETTAGAVLAVATAVAVRKSYVVTLAALRRRALARLRAQAGKSLTPAPRTNTKEAWQTFAKDVEKTEVNLKAAPRAGTKDQWATFAEENK